MGRCASSVLAAALAAAAAEGGWLADAVKALYPPTGERTMTVTGYCSCGKCCSWRRSWFGFGPAVHAKGALKGKRKAVGTTASGTKARKGTVAADTSVFPFGTMVWVPGYGFGTVEDRGGAITNGCIDLWFPSHAEALEWGRRKLKVRYWKKK